MLSLERGAVRIKLCCLRFVVGEFGGGEGTIAFAGGAVASVANGPHHTSKDKPIRCEKCSTLTRARENCEYNTQDDSDSSSAYGTIHPWFVATRTPADVTQADDGFLLSHGGILTYLSLRYEPEMARGVSRHAAYL